MMRTGLVTIILLALLLVGYVVYPEIGARFITPQAMLQAFPHFNPQNFDHNVIVRLCLSRLAAALLTDASPGIAGVLLQAVIRNPLGELHTLGLDARAALAVVAASAFGLAFPIGHPLLASTGGALLFLLILLLSSVGRSGLTPMRVTLCGVALSALISSVTATILILSEQTLLVMWTRLAGNLTRRDWTTLGTSAWLSLEGFVLAFCPTPSLSMLALGDRMAQRLGVSVLHTQTLTLLAIALLCDAAVLVADPVGFVGLLVPQTIRRLVSADLRVLLPFSACIGALLLLLTGIIARMLFMPHELAAGVMTALVGAPVFIIVVTRIFK